MYYIPLESFFLVQSVKKAIKIDSYDTKSEELTSSCLEDCFFLFKKVLRLKHEELFNRM